MTLKAFTQDTLEDSTWARILLVGAAKAGKTTACISTAPSTPFVINCDGIGALRYPVKVLKSKVDGADANNRAEWLSACDEAADRAEKGLSRIVIVDTLTLLCESLLEEMKTKFKGFDIWTERDEAVMEGFRILRDIPAHVIYVAHVSSRSEGPAGILPVVGGKSLAEKLPQQISDWIQFDIDPARKPERCFVLGAQKTWAHSGRRLQGSSLIEADLGLLLEEMGFEEPEPAK